MNNGYLLLLTIFLVILQTSLAGETVSPRGVCGDSTWVKFQDSKCYKLLEQYLTWDEAEEQCKNLSGSVQIRMATVKSAEEQAFLNDYLFNQSEVINNVWLGAARSEESENVTFIWDDGEVVGHYANWAVGSPTEMAGRDCVEMESGWTREDTVGLWKDVNCAKGNFGLCEQFQVWDAYEAQQAILANRLHIEELRLLVEGLAGGRHGDL